MKKQLIELDAEIAENIAYFDRVLVVSLVPQVGGGVELVLMNSNGDATPNILLSAEAARDLSLRLDHVLGRNVKEVV